jgi:hypothetical protein
MSDNGTTENEPTIVKHTHFKPSYAATIINYLLMPRPPLEEGEEPRPPRFDVKTLLLIMAVFIVFSVLIVVVASSERSVISSINLGK